MKTIKFLAITLIIALLACGLVACTEPTQTEATPTPEPTDNLEAQALDIAKNALSTYLANTTSEQYGVVLEAGTVLVVKVENRWYSYTYNGTELEVGEVTDTEPKAPEGLTLDTYERNLELIPENVSIYITETMLGKFIAKSALSDARCALSTYLANISQGDEGITVEPSTIFVVEKQGKWYSFSFDDGQLIVGDVTDTQPPAPSGKILDTYENNLVDVPENVSIYITAP